MISTGTKNYPELSRTMKWSWIGILYLDRFHIIHQEAREQGQIVGVAANKRAAMFDALSKAVCPSDCRSKLEQEAMEADDVDICDRECESCTGCEMAYFAFLEQA